MKKLKSYISKNKGKWLLVNFFLFIGMIFIIIFTPYLSTISNFRVLYLLLTISEVIGFGAFILYGFTLLVLSKDNFKISPDSIVFIIPLSLGLIFICNSFAGAVRPLKVLSGECYATPSINPDGEITSIDLIFPNISEKSYSLFGIDTNFTNMANQAEMIKDLDDIIDTSDHTQPIPDHYFCKRKIEVKALNTLFFFDVVLERKNL